MIPVSVILVARKATDNPDPRLAEVAVCGVSAAVCFIARGHPLQRDVAIARA